MGAAPAPEKGLFDYLALLRRRKKVIVLTALAVIVPTVLLSILQTPMYEAKAGVLLQQRNSETLFDADTGVRNDPTRDVQNELRIMVSEPMRVAVREKLGAGPRVSAVQDGSSDLIQVVAKSTVPGQAAQVANTYAEVYIEYRRKQAVDDVLAAADQVQGKIGELQKQIDATPAGAARESLVQSQSTFKTKLDQLQVDGALKRGGAQLATPATVPTEPVSPKPVRAGLIAALFGLIFGIAVALIVDYLDDSIKTKDDLARLAPGIPVVGLIPAVAGWHGEDGARVISLDDPKSPAAEAYRTLRTSIQFLSLEHPMRTVQLTSPGAQEGKSTTLANLGVALARAGQRVTVVCCDLRRPRLHEFFGLENTIGFTSVLLGHVPLSGALQDAPAQPRLTVLPSGPLPPNPSELLASSRTGDVLASLKGTADVVLIDCPPVLPVTDAVILSGHVDATVLVCVATATTSKDASRAIELLQQVGAPIVGTVLNGVSTEGAYGYEYQYFRSYQQDDPATSSRRWTSKGVRTGKRLRSNEKKAGKSQPAART